MRYIVSIKKKCRLHRTGKMLLGKSHLWSQNVFMVFDCVVFLQHFCGVKNIVVLIN